MALNNNILSFKHPASRVRLDEQGEKTVAECRRVVERVLPKLMNGLFEKLDDALYELADKSTSDKLQTSYFDAMRAVRKNRNRIQFEFSSGITADFDRFWEIGPVDAATQEAAPEPDVSDLSLVDEEELEETLAVSNLVSKGENRYHRELYVLNRCFSHMAGGVDVDTSSNPLGPTALCKRFQMSIGELSVETPVRLVVYKLFDRQVMNYVGGLYDELNSLLGRLGYKPKAPTRIARSRGTPGRPGGYQGRDMPASAPGSDIGEGRASGEHVYDSGGYGPAADYGPGGGYGTEGGELAVEFFHSLQGLLTEYRTSAGLGGSYGGAHNNVPVVATGEVLGALASLQHDAADPNFVSEQRVAYTKKDIRIRLADTLHLEQDGKASRQLGKADEDTLDVISLLFEFVLEDPNLPDAMKALIARLQIPMLRVAIMDKAFFSRKLHPARRLLNSLAWAAVGWSDDGDRSENSLYGRIESIINRIIANFENDPSLFQRLNDEFVAYLERERRGAEIAEERTTQIIRGKEQLQAAKELVQSEIRSCMEGHQQIPAVIRNVLEEGWKDVLLLTYLRQGPDSEDWARNLDIAKQLLWSVGPKDDYAQRQDLLRAIPDLLRSLRTGLNGISYDQHKMARIFKELQACHIASLRGGKVKQTVPAASAVAEEADRSTAVDVEGEVQLADKGRTDTIQHDQFTAEAENLAVGSWVELQEDDGRRVRIKLSWKSDVTDSYMFVNRRGIKVLEMTLAGLAKLFRKGQVNVLENVQVPIMDRAMDAMLETLRSTGTAVH